MTATTKRIEGPTPNGGAYAIAVTDDEGNVEVTEYDQDGKPVARPYGMSTTSVGDRPADSRR